MDFKNTIHEYLEETIDDQEKTQNNNYMRNLIDFYLRYNFKEAKNPNDILCDRVLFKGNVLTLFQAGMNTTENMLNWIFRIIAAHPNAQKTVQPELDEVVGKERLPSLNDVQKLPYTQAVLLEMDRYVSLLPITFYHRTTENMLFEGYEIPQNTSIIANLWNAHNAPDLWTEPEKFDPTRFLDKNGEITNKAKDVMAFSIGNRNCLGEPLARMELFLVMTSFLQKFFFALPKGEETWKFQPDVYTPATRCIKSMICATPRI